MVRERATEECRSIGEAYDEGYEQGRIDFSKSEEYANAINEAYNKGVEIGKRELMCDAMVIKARKDTIDDCIDTLKSVYPLWQVGLISKVIDTLEKFKGE